MLVEWSSEFSLGIEEIDRQHQGFFEASHRLHDAVLNAQGETVVEETLRFLQDYAAQHFRDEEALMQQHHYPDIQAHKQVHARFLEKIGGITEDYDIYLAPSQGMADELLEMTQGWLISHIADVDTKYARYIQQSK